MTPGDVAQPNRPKGQPARPHRSDLFRSCGHPLELPRRGPEETQNQSCQPAVQSAMDRPIHGTPTSGIHQDQF